MGVTWASDDVWLPLKLQLALRLVRREHLKVVDPPCSCRDR